MRYKRFPRRMPSSAGAEAPRTPELSDPGEAWPANSSHAPPLPVRQLLRKTIVDPLSLQHKM